MALPAEIVEKLYSEGIPLESKKLIRVGDAGVVQVRKSSEMMMMMSKNEPELKKDSPSLSATLSPKKSREGICIQRR